MPTLRNWLIGWHIAEYELHGADRAKYGEKLLATLSAELEAIGVSSCGRRHLYQYLRFHQVYPQIARSVTAQFPALIPMGLKLVEKVRSATAQSGVEPENILRQLSYTHIEQLVALDDSAARAFYERECIQGTGPCANSSARSPLCTLSAPACPATTASSNATCSWISSWRRSVTKTSASSTPHITPLWYPEGEHEHVEQILELLLD